MSCAPFDNNLRMMHRGIKKFWSYPFWTINLLCRVNLLWTLSFWTVSLFLMYGIWTTNLFVMSGTWTTKADGIWTTHLVLRDGTSSINLRWNFHPFRTLLRSLLNLFMEFWTVGLFSMYGTWTINLLDGAWTTNLNESCTIHLNMPLNMIVVRNLPHVVLMTICHLCRPSQSSRRTPAWTFTQPPTLPRPSEGRRCPQGRPCGVHGPPGRGGCRQDRKDHGCKLQALRTPFRQRYVAEAKS